MTNQVIPEAAVEAAARGIVASLPNDAEFEMHRTWATGYARAALEAAAPHMLAPSAVSAVLALHREQQCLDEEGEPVGGSYCEECKDLDDHSGERVHEVYPCVTVREITKALAGEETFTAMRDWIESLANRPPHDPRHEREAAHD